MDSNKATRKSRGAITPQRRNGRARVAALLETGAAVIAEKGFDAATMAEIAARANAPIGSLYRFFPSKEILANALVQRYAVLVNDAFDALEGQVGRESLESVADAILEFKIKFRSETKTMLGLLGAYSDCTARRMEFRNLVLNRLAKILRLYAPAMADAEARDIAVLLLHNLKTMAELKFNPNVPNSPGAPEELRQMNRWYLVNRVAAAQ
jgi:AcrR family transcriptional regulator